MGRVEGTKRWRLVIEGQVPPGVSDDTVPMVVLSSVHVNLPFINHIQMAEVKIIDTAPPDAARKSRLSL